MSSGVLSSRQRSASRSSNRSANSIPPPGPSITPKQDEVSFEPCAATAAFFLYAQRNVILCLHHDTLAIERRFTGHREDVSWMYVDNVSERGAGRLVVSYDAGNTAIVWDLMTGDEVARFASYEHIRVAAWMRNGNVAFGNSQGNVILFEPSTSEHVSARTIFDPITALAPVADCRTFAIGYLNGSILIATLQPAFTILHTLTTPKAPSPLVGLAWHGSSSRQKSEMLATQTQDGDLRVWSVPKAPHSDAPCVIRVLSKSDVREPGPVWFNWSKTGRIVQHSEGQTNAWDVRTKRVTFDSVPTIEGVVGITNYGPTASLFTMGRNHTIQQYDINPNGTPSMVCTVQHPPSNTPPSPPNSIDEIKAQETSSSISSRSATSTPAIAYDTTSSEGEANTMSPLQRIAQEMDALEEERRDRVGPLSPTSSRASMSSRSSGGGARRRYRYDRPSSSRHSNNSSETGTVFSLGTASKRSGHESVSIRSVSSTTSSHYKPSSLRKEIQKMREEPQQQVELFPFVKARLSEVAFHSPRYSAERTVDELRQQMLSVVFGWEDETEALIRDELARHKPGSAGAVLLSKWLGDDGADMMASMIGSDSMSSSDWMLLALSAMGNDSQKKVGQAFTQRLLEKGDIHPAVAILLGLGEPNDAIEVYVSRKYYMEAVILTCLLFPNDWQRQSYLVRKWGEVAVLHKQPELAVRCFSCTSLESAEPWFSPAAQDAVFVAQKESLLGSQLSPPLSPPGGLVPSRMKNASLKLITSFGDRAGPGQPSTTDERTPMNVGVTPIAESAISPGGATPWARPTARGMRDPSSARTATPGAYTRRKRYPSRSDHERSTSVEPPPFVPPTRRQTPQTAIETQRTIEVEIPFHKRSMSQSTNNDSQILSAVAYDPTKSTASVATSLPSPAVGVFAALRESRSRNGSRSRKPGDLHLDMGDLIIRESQPATQAREPSPPLTGASLNSLKSAKIRSIDQYISSLDEATHYARAQSRTRATSRESKSRSRQPSESRGGRTTPGVKYIKPAKRSPSSPISMSPDDAHLFAPSGTDNFDDERYYKITSPTESTRSRTGRARSRSKVAGDAASVRASSKVSRKVRSPEGRSNKPSSRAVSRNRSRQPSPDRQRTDSRGRTLIPDGSQARSPSSPLPMASQARFYREDDDEEFRHPSEKESESRRRQRSRSQRPGDRATSTRREKSPDRRATRDRSSSRRPTARESSRRRENVPTSPDAYLAPSTFKGAGTSNLPKLNTDLPENAAALLRKKEMAARELEERRLSLARRPSAPVIPLPGEFGRPIMPGRSNSSNNEMGSSPTTLLPSFSYADRITRSQTVDPEALSRLGAGPKSTFGHSTTSTPIGLPATPRAMRHPRYMSSDPRDRANVPEVPPIPSKLQQRSPLSEQPPAVPAHDDIAPLLPATTYGQTVNKPPPRSMSVPLERHEPNNRSFNGNNGHAHRSSNGGFSPVERSSKRVSPTITASIDETLRGDNQIIIVDGGAHTPPMLPELRHLSTPPPPPPPPMFPSSNSPSTLGSGVINIAIDEMSGNPTGIVEVPSPPQPYQAPAGSASPPNGHRRGRGSVSESIGSRLRGVTDRMRSASRSRNNKSPPMDPYSRSPYESIPPMDLHRRGSVSHGKSSSSESIGDIPMTLPSLTYGQEQVIPPSSQQSQQNQQTQGGYVRNPKEIRANMPPTYLQPGAMPMENGGGMI